MNTAQQKMRILSLDAELDFLSPDHICMKVVHLLGQGALEDDDGAPFRVLSGGGSDLARVSCSLRHDTAYKPHEVCCGRLWMSVYLGSTLWG